MHKVILSVLIAVYAKHIVSDWPLFFHLKFILLGSLTYPGKDGALRIQFLVDYLQAALRIP